MPRQTTKHATSQPYSQRLIYVSRTHAQLDQVTRELKRLPYRPMMSLLASRERFCLHAVRCRFHIIWPVCAAKVLQNAPSFGEQVAQKRPNNKKYAANPIACS